MIKKENDKYYVYSEKGRKLSVGYETEEEAQSRLKEIEGFKQNATDECPCKKDTFQDRAFTLDISYEDKQMLSKNVISVRDGYQEYLGAEIGLTPADKIFKIYRSPETIRELNEKLKDIPLTIDHLDNLDVKVPESAKVGKILRSEVIPSTDKVNASTISLKNEIYTDENKLKYNSYKQLSLGYKATTLPHSIYDFEQVDIRPHHLAIVESGRCGNGCKFLDKQGVQEMEFEELLKNLKDSLGKMKDEDKTSAMGQLSKLLPKQEGKDEDMQKVKDEAKEEAKKEFADSLEKVKEEALSNFKDSEVFKVAMRDAGNERVSVINKAINYLDKDYKFEDKHNDEIMRDALKAEFPNESFKDSEISVAFKMLKEKARVEEVTYNDSSFKTVTDTFNKEF